MDTQNVKITDTTDARKERINHDQAWQVLNPATTIIIAKGKKQLSFTPDSGNRDEILKAAMGPSGNLRAPTLRIGTQIIVGFNPDLYQNTFS